MEYTTCTHENLLAVLKFMRSLGREVTSIDAYDMYVYVWFNRGDIEIAQ